MFAMVRTKSFWSIFIAASIASAVVGGHYLFKVLPLMSIDLHMNKQQALAKTTQIAQKHQWAPENAWQAAHFENDTMAQFFAELECGGIDVFQKMIQDKLYEPYQWHVRNYKEGVTQETHLFFTPQGEPYGFEIKLAENETPGNVSVTQARSLALKLAQKDWNISFENYKEVEASKEETPQGRVDHTFLYERTDTTLGKDGKYRIKLMVRGNVFSHLKQFVLVPEAFQRRYQEVRSQNNVFGAGFLTLFQIFYVLIGGLIGGFILLKRRRYLLGPALAWIGILGTFSLLNTLNTLPLAWMSYNTAQSSHTFLLTIIAQSIFGVIQSSIMFLLVVGAGESFGRWAFPDHLQLWKSWSKEVGGSLTVLGQTVGGYGLFCLELSIGATLYFILNKGFGWWSPTGVLLNPNVLAMRAPWFAAFTGSLTAGFWEEFGCRALPLAGMILLGRYFKKERTFLVLAMIIQAIVFGGLHASYPQQPVYFRIVELFVPSLVWGSTYLMFGLLPCIICHYLWDLMWFSLPIMVSDASGLFIQKAIVLLVGAAPLLIVLFRRMQVNSWKYATASLYNRAWKIPAATTSTTDTAKQKTVTSTLSNLTIKVVLAAGLAGCIAFGFFGKNKNSNPQLTISKEAAIASATAALKELPNTDKPWTVLTQADSGLEPQQLRNYKHIHKFVWQTQPRETYYNLLGNYLTSAHWKIRFSLFEGDVAERAEEYVCFVNTKGQVYRILHVLPEGKKGASLSEGEARGIALNTIKERFGLEAKQLKEISAIALQKLERKDWNFVFQDTDNDLKGGGQAHITITIGGDKLVDYERFVFVPETWIRTESLKEGTLQTFVLFCYLLFMIFIIIGLMNGAHQTFSSFNFMRFLKLFFVVLVASIMSLINTIPLFSFSFGTAQPYQSQLFSIISMQCATLLLKSAGVAFLLNSFVSMCQQRRYKRTLSLYAVGLLLPATWCGVAVLCKNMFPELFPTAASLSILSLYSPVLQSILYPITNVLFIIAVLAPLSVYVTKVTNNWKKNTVIGLLLSIVFGIIIIGVGGVESITQAIVVGIPVGIIFCLAHRFVLAQDPSLLILVLSSSTLLTGIQAALLNGYPSAHFNAVVLALVTISISTMWFKTIQE